MAAKEDNTKLYLGLGVLLLIYFAGNKIFQKVGLTKTKEEEKKEKEQQQNYEAQLTQQYFDPDYFKERHKKYYCKSLTTEGAKGYATILYNAKGYFNDDEEAVYGVFKQLSAKTQVSVLSDIFYQMYKKDLKAYLQSFMNQKEFGNVLAICERMIEGISTDGQTWK